jgi:hypothetical protein
MIALSSYLEKRIEEAELRMKEFGNNVDAKTN